MSNIKVDNKYHVIIKVIRFMLNSKTYPISDQHGQNLYPFSDQNGSKTIPFGAAHTYIAYIREYPPPPDINIGITKWLTI